ncbi:uncharacterized protein LOC121352177 [Pyrgilauda ruficollis]|uniref:uncharacterized protein LOC121352177 n=1 Tax=Pyrgilauda ruficollis TaxID=221976 RepID=UPI001B87BDB9|nr:uncharacterized protein LOC121352177 [Pyrgilauda ruficollis]
MAVPVPVGAGAARQGLMAVGEVAGRRRGGIGPKLSGRAGPCRAPPGSQLWRPAPPPRDGTGRDGRGGGRWARGGGAAGHRATGRPRARLSRGAPPGGTEPPGIPDSSEPPGNAEQASGPRCAEPPGIPGGTSRWYLPAPSPGGTEPRWYRGTGQRWALGSGAPLLRDPRLVLPGRFLRDDYSIQVAINDYLDIYCPHYEGAVPAGRAETFTLFMVDREGYRGCYETPGAFKRWECNRPRAPFGPVRFSEKIQRFTPFSLGFEFQPGETYYYISVPSPESAGRCLKLRVTVCCRGTTPEPVTEVPNSQPRGRGGPEDVAPARGTAVPSQPCSPCLTLVLLALLWI